MEDKMVSQYRRFTLFAVVVVLAGLVLSACGGSTSGAGKTTDVNVTMTDFSFSSSTTNFKQGVTYHFIVKNNGAVAHEFEIMPPATGTLSADQVKQSALAGISADQLGPGATATVDYTFTQAYPSGSLEFACHVSGHYEAGMHLGIVVQ
jgi:uncharacterized cupredoxin-like copper-binding protein